EEQPSCEEPKVGTLMLVDANTDQDLIEITDGAVINLQLFSNPMNINAIPEDCPTTMVRSVRFFLEGPIDITKTESVAPYALGGDNSGNYNPITFPTGTYTLRTIAYSEKGTKGTAGTPVDISFIIVNEDPNPCADGTPTIDAGENMVLTCNEASTLLSASASEGGSFNWSGPNGFSANSSSVTVSQPGTYTVDFTNANGCTVSDAVEVSRPAYEPVSSIPTAVSIGCETGEARINVVASDYDSFSWSGPNGFTSNMLSPDVTLAGTYTITFQKGVGCTASYTVTASELDTYDPISSIPSQISLNCEQTEGTISVVAEPYTTVSWSSPNGFSSTELSPTVADEGTYTLTLTYGASCVETASVQVVRQTNGFNPFVSFPTGLTIPCEAEGVSIPVSLSGYDSYSWAGPEGFSSMDISPFVGIPGTYTMTVNSVGGCSVSRSVTVNLDTYDPVISIPAVVELDCITETASITTEIGAYTSLQWTGPGNFQSSTEDIEVNTEGVYTLTVSSLAGCAQQYEVLVEGCPDECEESTVASLIIVNADTDQDVMSIQDGAIYNLNDFGHNIAIRAEEDACTFDVKSVRMVLSGAQDFSRTESKAPWALFGDSGGNFSPWIAKPGSYTLSATPYSEKGAKGTAGASKVVSFSITNPQSNFQSFTVLNELLEGGETQVYVAPNRASKLTYIYLEGEETGLVDVEVINILGARTHEFQATKESFKSQHTLSLDNLTEGMYWVRVKFAQREYVRKLVIEK
ncbi:MAG: T9SS type A sorting domain-containing protein, partial [Bacteroidota bacterium]